LPTQRTNAFSMILTTARNYVPKQLFPVVSTMKTRCL